MSTSTENTPRKSESGAAASDHQAGTQQPPPSHSSDDLLEVARFTGLREHMHGVNATEARIILQRFVGALRLLHADSDAPTPPTSAADAVDAARYRGWRDAAVANNDAFARALHNALPPEARKGKPRWPSANEWDAGVDAALAASKEGSDGVPDPAA